MDNIFREALEDMLMLVGTKGILFIGIKYTEIDLLRYLKQSFSIHRDLISIA